MRPTAEQVAEAREWAEAALRVWNDTPPAPELERSRHLRIFLAATEPAPEPSGDMVEEVARVVSDVYGDFHQVAGGAKAADVVALRVLSVLAQQGVEAMPSVDDVIGACRVAVDQAIVDGVPGANLAPVSAQAFLALVWTRLAPILAAKDAERDFYRKSAIERYETMQKAIDRADAAKKDRHDVAEEAQRVTLLLAKAEAKLAAFAEHGKCEWHECAELATAHELDIGGTLWSVCPEHEREGRQRGFWRTESRSDGPEVAK